MIYTERLDCIIRISTYSVFGQRVKVVVLCSCTGQIAGARKVAHIKYSSDRADLSNCARKQRDDW